MKLRVHKLLADTTAEGPGHRFCIWVQGCSRHCPGCMAVHTWDSSAGTEMDTAEIICMIRKQKGLEGLTFLGGEPFEQAGALAEIACAVRKDDLSVICFTGYTLEELQKDALTDGNIAQLLAEVDVLIDGAYEEARRDFSRPWVGSANQRFIYLTGRYSAGEMEQRGNRLEIRIRKDGSILVNGMADFTQTGSLHGDQL